MGKMIWFPCRALGWFGVGISSGPRIELKTKFFLHAPLPRPATFCQVTCGNMCWTEHLNWIWGKRTKGSFQKWKFLNYWQITLLQKMLIQNKTWNWIGEEELSKMNMYIVWVSPRSPLAPSSKTATRQHKPLCSSLTKVLLHLCKTNHIHRGGRSGLAVVHMEDNTIINK